MPILRISLVLLQFIFMMTGLIYLIFSKDLPKIETITEIKLTNPMRIYSEDNQLIGLFGTEKRQIVNFEESEHEIFMEKDELRKKMWSSIDNFLKN